MCSVQPLLLYNANTVCGRNFNARVAVVHLPAVTFNWGCNSPLENVHIAHRLEAPVLKTIKFLC